MKHFNRNIANLTFAGVVGTLAASSAPAAPTSRVIEPDFKVYDSNGDGAVSPEEFRARGGGEEAFRDGDANGDRRLTGDEFIKANAANGQPKAGKLLDDAWITAKVKTLLLKDEGVKGIDVQVQTHKGTVLLSGSVDDAGKIPRAQAIARGVEGVKAVSSDLRVKPLSRAIP